MRLIPMTVLALAVCWLAAAAAVEVGARKHHHHRHYTPPPPLQPQPPVPPGGGAPPLMAMRQHVCGLHRSAADPNEQMIAHHYCSKLPDGLTQCALFDTDQPNARLIGIEYIITAERFKALNETERKLWHSHVFEVQSGQLTPMPLAGGGNDDIPIAEQRAALEELMGTFGKTIHTWNYHALNAEVPIGAPELMVSFTGQNQANEKLLDELDERAGNRYWERAAWRQSGPNQLRKPAVMQRGVDAPEFRGVDAWQTGVTPFIQITNVKTDTRQLPAERAAMKHKEAVPLDMGNGEGDEVEVELKPAERKR